MAKEFSLEKKTGVIIAVVIGAIVLFFVLKLMNNYVFNKNTYYILFDNASLIRENAPVYIDKAVVGFVKELSLTTDTKKATVKVKINKKINIPDKSIAQIFSTDPSQKNKAIRIILFSSSKYLSNMDTLTNIPSATINISQDKIKENKIIPDTIASQVIDTIDKPVPVPDKKVQKPDLKVDKSTPKEIKTSIEKKTDEKTQIPIAKSEITYKVQFLVSKNDYQPNNEVFKGIANISKSANGGVFKYLAGNETSKANAQLKLSEIQAKGFKDAFIVVFKNGKKLTGDEALKYLNK